MRNSGPSWPMLLFRCAVSVALCFIAFSSLGHSDEIVEYSALGVAATHGPLPRSFFTTKTPYNPPENSVFYDHSLNDKCELTHVNFVSRHGSRHLNKLTSSLSLAAKLAEADAASELTDWGKTTLAWLQRFVASEKDRVGLLAPRGHTELYNVGKRFGVWANRTLSKELPRGQRLKFTSTTKQRAIASRDAFLEGMLSVLDPSLANNTESHVPIECGEDGMPTSAFNLLRFFDSCKAYEDYAGNEASLEAMVQDVLDDVRMPVADHPEWERDVLEQILVESSPLLNDETFVSKAVATLYSACQIQGGAHGVETELCMLFRSHSHLLAALELRDDLEEYFEKGGGHSLAYGQSCVLLEDVFSSMDATVAGANDGSTTFGHFRFGHAETLMPFVALLRLYESQPFPSYEDYANGGINAHMRTESKKVWLGSGAVVVPMAAHVGLFLYNCGADGWKVLVTHNERVVRMPACQSEDMCPLHQMKAYYRDHVYPSLGFGACGVQDWMNRCQGTVGCAAASTSNSTD